MNHRGYEGNVELVREELFAVDDVLEELPDLHVGLLGGLEDQERAPPERGARAVPGHRRRSSAVRRRVRASGNGGRLCDCSIALLLLPPGRWTGALARSVPGGLV